MSTFNPTEEISNAALIEANPVASFVIDRNHVITHWNRACEQLLGAPAATMIGTCDSWRPFYPAPRATMANLIVEESISEIIDSIYWGKMVRRSSVVKDAYEAEDFFPHLGNGGRWLFFTASPIRNSAGEIVGAIETLQDITTQRIAEESLRRANEQLEMRVEERTKALAEANQKLATRLSEANAVSTMKSAFLAAVSGELKSPINEIVGFASLIQMNPTDPAGAEHAREILDSSKHLDKLINDLISLAELKGGQAHARLSRFSAPELIANTTSAFHSRAIEKGIGFSVNVDASTPEILRGDSARVQNTICKILESAFEATESGTINVDVSGDDASLIIRVRDAGVTSQTGASANMFSYDVQNGEMPWRKFGNSGFGLALATAQAELCGGTIEVQPQPGNGSVVTLRMPVEANSA